MRALITGVGGFAGRYLARHLLDQDEEVIGLGRAYDCVGLPPAVRLEVADLCERDAIQAAIHTIRPDAVYHLAAQSSTRDSLANPWGTISNNLLGQLNLLEAVLSTGERPRILVVGSADEYGVPEQSTEAVGEDTPLRPATPYAVSKVGQDVLGYQYFAQYQLPVVRVRPFSHTGPGHDERFAIPSFAKQLAEIELGLREPVLRVGNLSVERDLTDVRDMVRAYHLAVLAGEPGGVYNLGHGRAISMQTVVDSLVEQCHAKVEVVVAEDRLRPTDVPRLVADVSRFRVLTGWAPAVPWQSTLRDTLDYWRGRVGVASTVS